VKLWYITLPELVALIHPDRLSVALGKAVVHNNKCIAYIVSVFKGGSGAPSFSEVDGWQNFVSIYTGAILDKDNKFLPSIHNHGLLVSHPSFVKNYVTHVLPTLLERDKVDDDIKSYLQVYAPEELAKIRN